MSIITSFETLPGAMTNGTQAPLVKAILETFDNTILQFVDFYSDYLETIIDPTLVDESTLDWLGTQPISGWRLLWNTEWNTDTKRLLLRDQNLIFSRRLYPDTISLLFSHFKLKSKLIPKSGFILGALPIGTPLPQTLGNSILNYKISLPKEYTEATRELDLTRFIVQNFGIPAQIDYVYDQP